MRRALAFAGVSVVTCLALLSSPLSGEAFAGGVSYDPTGYLEWLETNPAGGIAVESTDVELTSVCLAGPWGAVACAATAAGALAWSHWGSSVWHWAFGGGHSGQGGGGSPGVSVQPGYGMSVGTNNITFVYPAPEHAGLTYVFYVATNPTSQIGGSLTNFQCHPATSGGVVTDPCTGLTSSTITGVCMYWTSPTTAAAEWGNVPGSPCTSTTPDGNGSVTVTGYCYDPSTFAADGSVSGSSSWSSSATSVPDTTLPACPGDDMMGGVNVTGTGSSSGTTGGGGLQDGGIGAPQQGGPITVTGGGVGHPIPAKCLSESAECSTVWEHAEGQLWVQVAPVDVPANPGFDYRCEVVTSAGDDVVTVDDGACPAPGTSEASPEPTASPSPTAGLLGPPKDDGDPTGNGLDPGSCFPSGWGLLNPVEWVVKPGICLFAPSPSSVSEMQGLEADLEAREPFSGISAAVGWLTTAFGSGGGGSCSLNWSVSFPPPIGDVTLLSCGNPIIGILRSYRDLFEAAVWVAFLAPLAWWAWRTYAPGAGGSS